MHNPPLQEQLAALKPFVKKTEETPVVSIDMQLQEASVSLPSGIEKRGLSNEQSQRFIENALRLQEAALREKHISLVTAVAMAVGTTIFAAGAGLALIKGSKGNINSTLF